MGHRESRRKGRGENSDHRCAQPGSSFNRDPR